MHSIVSKEYINLLKDSSDPMDAEDLHKLSLDPITWTEQTRYVRGEKFTFNKREYLHQLYRDLGHTILIKKGRQTEITEYLLNMILFNAWKYAGTIHVYMADRQGHTYKFSNHRMKIEAIKNSEMIQKIVNYKDHTTTKMVLKNGSIVYFLSAWNGFIEAESIATDFAYLDEIHAVDLAQLASLRESMAHSKYNILYGVGIGTIEGSEWDKLFKKSTMNQWDSKCKAWIPKYPNARYSGYHIPQTIVPYITSQQIQLKKLDYPPAAFEINVMGNTVKGSAVPLSAEDIKNVLIPSLNFTMPDDVDHSAGPVFIGIDWGGGNKAFTVPYITQFTNPHIPIWKLLYTTRITDSNTDTQIQKISNLIDAYNPDIGVQDIGGGIHQTQAIDAAYGYKICKCHFSAPIQTPYVDDKFVSQNLIKVHRSYALELVFDMIKLPYIDSQNNTIYKTQIPHAEPDKMQWLFDDFTSMYGEDAKTLNGLEYIRYDKAPTDTNDGLMAAAYNLVATEIWKRRMRDDGDISVAY